MLGEHASFILAAYAGSAAVLAALVAWIMLDGRAVRRSLDEMDARGVRRRSAGREEGQ
ncbi:heme exporter protein CcmD [Starkeya sp. ORNL1]|uniref:heme exporter protein CcmD n=1 Tax=Starkeya sp. ORNL1 TaxID=2709380 RepID=UPI00146434B1|nr:heme exporter protein CcmD [Starkeya sp. ORNL1]QJP16662.1 heme exporter protein CcmD [Starkeya sp. ORNL1]